MNVTFSNGLGHVAQWWYEVCASHVNSPTFYTQSGEENGEGDRQHKHTWTISLPSPEKFPRKLESQIYKGQQNPQYITGT